MGAPGVKALTAIIERPRPSSTVIPGRSEAEIRGARTGALASTDARGPRRDGSSGLRCAEPKDDSGGDAGDRRRTTKTILQ
jgi:hypothetical protein